MPFVKLSRRTKAQVLSKVYIYMRLVDKKVKIQAILEGVVVLEYR